MYSGAWVACERGSAGALNRGPKDVPLKQHAGAYSCFVSLANWGVFAHRLSYRPSSSAWFSAAPDVCQQLLYFSGEIWRGAESTPNTSICPVTVFGWEQDHKGLGSTPFRTEPPSQTSVTLPPSAVPRVWLTPFDPLE